MATADEILAGLSTGDDTTLVIDNYLRTIAIPSKITNLGVESDDDVLTLNFKMPRYLDDIDLSKFSIRINYMNARGEGDVYSVNDKDKTVGADSISFSWLVGPTATAYKGNTKFNVCMKTMNGEGYIEKEYNTTIATLPVLEGLEVDEQVVEMYSDILEQWKRELFGIGDTEEASMRAVSQEEQEKLVQKGAEVLATIPEEYQETAEAAQEGIRTKADAIIKNAQGATIVVNDSSDDHIRNLRVFGKTTQVTTTGKNLLNITLQSHSINGGIVMVNPDKTIELRGKFTSNTALAIGKFAHSGECIFSAGIDSASMNNSYLYVAYPDTNIGWYGEDKVFTNDGTERTVFLVIVAGSYKNVTLKPMIRFSSIEDSSYEPYSGGFVSPSLEWPQDMIGVGDDNAATVWVHGKNLAYASETTMVTMKNGITISSVQGSSEYVLGGTQNGECNASANLTKSGIRLTPGTFTLSVIGLRGDDYINLQRQNYDVSKVEYITTGITNKTSRTFTISNLEETVYVELVVYSTSTYNNDVVTIQLEAGDTATEHENHKQEQTIQRFAHVSRSRILNSIPVASGGNYTDANGLEWVCDEVNFDRGMYIQRIGVITLETVDNIQYSLSGKTGRGQLIITPSLDKNRSRDVTMCNLAVANGMALEAVNGQYYVNPVNMVLVGDIDETEEDMLEKYSALEMFYILETPVETALTAEEIEAYKVLRTNYPNTTIINNVGAHMELSYNADTKTYVDNEIKQTVTDVLEAIENGSY